MDMEAPHDLAEGRDLTTPEFTEMMNTALASAISPKHPSFRAVQQLIDLGRKIGKIPDDAVISIVYRWQNAYAIFITEAPPIEALCDCEDCMAAIKRNKPTIH